MWFTAIERSFTVCYNTIIEALLFKAQLRWTGHVIRMDASRMPRQILYGELVRGTRKKGRTKKRYKDCIKETLKQCSLPPRDLETCAQDRPGWRATVKSACSKFEDNRRDKISDARAHRKASVTTPDEATFQCPHCPRLCASRIGLYSHARTHRQWIPQKRHLRIRWSTDDDNTIVYALFTRGNRQRILMQFYHHHNHKLVDNMWYIFSSSTT